MSRTYINESSGNLLRYIADDSVRQLCSGQLVPDILVVVLEPPTFWNALEKCYDERTLSPSGIYAFACLLLELFSLPPNLLPLNTYDVAEKALDIGGLLDSFSTDTRSLANRIRDAVRCRASSGTLLGTIKPGSRHDNDFEDFSEIAIFPTTGEVLAKEEPSYLQSDAVFEIEPEK